MSMWVLVGSVVFAVMVLGLLMLAYIFWPSSGSVMVLPA